MNKSNSTCTRRTALRSLVGGSLILPAILKELCAAPGPAKTPLDPLAPKTPHFPARAKRVIFMFMPGGISHIDSFDPKPKLKQLHGKNKYLQSYWNASPRGKCGTEVTDLFPHIAGCMDDICLIRSMKSDHSDHFQSTLGIHTGSVTFARPSIGSWISYGLGTFNQNLPSFVVVAPKLPYAGSQVFANDFLPAYHQGTQVIPGPNPIPNLKRRADHQEIQEMELGLAEIFNRLHLQDRQNDLALAARIKSFETAFHMQREATEVFDVSAETDTTLKLYGLERGQTDGYGWQCLVARRLAERGVRFIELIDQGSSNNWDAHRDMADHAPLAKNIDLPIAGLIRDLKSLGMLDDTLLVFTTEFGRSPRWDGDASEAKGRSHHNRAFSSWLAGGGVKPGFVHGATDETGDHIIRDQVHVHDFHATILHILGLDHTKLTYHHAGRDFRLTDVHGKVVHNILA